MNYVPTHELRVIERKRGHLTTYVLQRAWLHNNPYRGTTLREWRDCGIYDCEDTAYSDLEKLMRPRA